MKALITHLHNIKLFSQGPLIVLLALIFLLPLIVSPIGLLSFPFMKVFTVVVAVVLSFAIIILATLKRGSAILPRDWTMLALFGVPVVALISALLSGDVARSLIGYGVETDTFFFVTLMFVLLMLVATVFRTTQRIFYAYIAFIAALGVLYVFHMLRFVFGVEVLALDSLFPVMTSNTFGKWNDLAILSGVVAIMSTLLVETTRSTKAVRIVALVFFALSLVFLAIVNFALVWIVLGILSLVLFVYLFSFQGGTERKVPLLPVILLAVSVLFFFAGDVLGRMIAEMLSISAVDVRPFWSSTFGVAREALDSITSILVGTGPNTFAFTWEQFKPGAVLQSVLWNTSFDYGVSYLATALVTLGVLGVAAWGMTLVMFLYQGFKALFSQQASDGGVFRTYIVLSSSIITLFLWVMLLLYVPGIVVIVMTFIFTGLFLASVLASGTIPVTEISFIQKPKIGFVVTLVLVFALIGTVGLGYISFQKTVSSIYYQRGLVALNQAGNVAQAGNHLSEAAALAEHDVYYRALVDVNLIQLNQILNSEDLTSSVVEERAQQALTLAVRNAQRAIEVNPQNYTNYILLGNVYASLAPLGVQGVIEGARGAYEEALVYSPKNPGIYLALARLQLSEGNTTEAREYITQALQFKNNYTDAFFTLAQIEVADGNTDEAISSVEVATLLDSRNPALRFQLGLLYYNDDDYANAAASFENAINLIPEYANAKYFLGLSYYELGERALAIQQFEELLVTNPESQEVEFILDNLRAGNAPFADVAPPLDDEPENREELPLEEEEL